jgi:hypothetical protein
VSFEERYRALQGDLAKLGAKSDQFEASFIEALAFEPGILEGFAKMISGILKDHDSVRSLEPHYLNVVVRLAEMHARQLTEAAYRLREERAAGT